MIELKGKPVADDIKEKAMKRVEELRSQGIIPKIATIRVGDDPGDIAYEHGICSRAEEMGIDVCILLFRFPEPSGNWDFATNGIF